MWSCPYCHYSDYYTKFFRMLPFKREMIKRVLHEQHANLKTPFDQLVIRYLEAIHINEAVNADDCLSIGRLWLGLYWLFVDAEDETMQRYCAEKAAPLLDKALKTKSVSDELARHRFQLTASVLYNVIGDKKNTVRLCEEATSGDDGTVKKFALTFMNGLR